LCSRNLPDYFFAYNAFLFANQPSEGSYGPENDALYKDVEDLLDAGAKTQFASNLKTIKGCINDGSYDKWIADNTKTLVTAGNKVPGTQFELKGTPFVMVNDQQYTYGTTAELTDPARFAAFVQTVAAS